MVLERLSWRVTCHNHEKTMPYFDLYQNDATWEGNDIGSREMHVIVFVLMSVENNTVQLASRS